MAFAEFGDSFACAVWDFIDLTVDLLYRSQLKGREAMIIDGIEIHKIRPSEIAQCEGQVRGPAIVNFNGISFCATCFGAEVLGGDHSPALIGFFCTKLLDD